MENEIPEMTHPLSVAWDQPKKEEILIDDLNATMEEKTFNKLKEYSTSIPSGVYEGKMWKAKVGSSWILRWFGTSTDPNKCSNHQRNIIII